MKLTPEERAVCKQLGLSESEFAKSKAEDMAQRGHVGATPRRPATVIDRALTPEQRAVCKQMGISSADMALEIAESSPAIFMAQFAKAHAVANDAAASGFRSGDKVKIAPGHDKNGPARGTITFDASADDGLLRSGDIVFIDPGDAGGIVKGTILSKEDDPTETGDEPHIIQEFDAVFIDTVNKCDGTIENLSKKAALKAKLAAVELKQRAERTRLANEKAKRARSPGAPRGPFARNGSARAAPQGVVPAEWGLVPNAEGFYVLPRRRRAGAR